MIEWGGRASFLEREKELEKKLAFSKQVNEEREKIRKEIEAEEKRQRELDRETARRRNRLTKKAKEDLAKQDEYIRLLEEAEKEY